MWSAYLRYYAFIDMAEWHSQKKAFRQKILLLKFRGKTWSQYLMWKAFKGTSYIDFLEVNIRR